MKSGSVIELKFGEDAKSNGDLLSAISDYTNLASRFTLTVGDNTDDGVYVVIWCERYADIYD